MFAVLPSMGAQLSLSGSSPTVGLESHSGDSYGLSGSIYKTFFENDGEKQHFPAGEDSNYSFSFSNF